MFKSLKLIMIACFFTSLLSCSESNEPAPDIGESYFPLVNGQEKIYTLDSVIYSAINNSKDSFRRYLKEKIVSVVSDSSGYSVFKVVTYITADTNLGWKYMGYHFCKKNKYHVLKTIGNTTQSVFVFPVVKNKEWNKNLYNALDPEYAYYSFTDKPFDNFTQCAEVFISNDVNIIEEKIDKAVYAKGFGLVYSIKRDVRINLSKKNGFGLITKLLK
jgi:hypothetical protein